jgi:hypothetical protein
MCIFEAADIYLAVGRSIEHSEMGHAYLAAGSPPYVLMTVYPPGLVNFVALPQVLME